jgi:hypothetical protein
MHAIGEGSLLILFRSFDSGWLLVGDEWKAASGISGIRLPCLYIWRMYFFHLGLQGWLLVGDTSLEGLLCTCILLSST